MEGKSFQLTAIRKLCQGACQTYLLEVNGNTLYSVKSCPCGLLCIHKRPGSAPPTSACSESLGTTKPASNKVKDKAWVRVLWSISGLVD